MVEDSSGMEGSLGRRMTLRRLNVAEARGWILGVVDFSVEALGSWNTCHHPDEGRILTTTDAPTFSLIEVYEREVGDAKILGLKMI